MSFPRMIALGLLAVVLLTVLPLLLLGQVGTPGSRVAQLLDIEQLGGHLQSEAFRLRLGASRNYDGLTHTYEELSRRHEALLAEVGQSAAPEDAAILADLREHAITVRQLGQLVQRFPTFNASALQAVSSLPRVMRGLQEPVGVADPVPQALQDELEEEYRSALLLQARWDPTRARRALERYRERAPQLDDQHAATGNVLRHLELAIEHRLLADELLGEIQHLCLSSDLLGTIDRFHDQAELGALRHRNRALLIQGSSYTLAIGVCFALCVAGLRQSQRLQQEIVVRQRADDEARQYESQLRHAQKMESIGQLAAGIAHEINTPTQFVGDNTRFLRDSFGELDELTASYRRVAREARDGAIQPETLAQLDQVVSRVDPDYLSEEIPLAIEQSLEGLGRVAKIVQAMKEFSHPGGDEKTSLDINAALRSTVTVAGNEWKHVADLELELDPDLPHVQCLPGDVNQVFLNLIVNAAHAIDERLGTGSREKGSIRIRTGIEGEAVVIRIADTGGGIPEEIRERIFDPFFTTKEVGKGTGQGLAIAHSVIVQKHGGELDFESEPGVGTEFVITLPISGSPTLSLPSPAAA